MNANGEEQRRKGVYRSRHGMIFGVCQGLADYFNCSAFWLRMLAVGITIFTGFWPVPIMYVVAALVMKLEPVVPFRDEGDEEFYHSYVASRGMAVHRLKRTFDNLDRRIQRIEDIVTARSYDWDRRLRE